MSEHRLTEGDVLSRLNLPGFSKMGKKDAIRLGTLLPEMEPEVAKKALEQFPEFARTMGELMGEYRETLARNMQSNEEGVRACAESCRTILDALQRELDKGTLSFGEREAILDRMVEVSRLMHEKDSENKKFLWGLAGIAAAAVAAVGVAAAGLLGLRLGGDKEGNEK